MGKLTISMAIFNSYVSLPEGNISQSDSPKLIPSHSHHPRASMAEFSAGMALSKSRLAEGSGKIKGGPWQTFHCHIDGV